jgi:hypothetical protein
MSIFESKEQMGPINVASPERIGTALTREQAQDNETPALFDRIKDAHVRNLAPVYRGKHY